MKILAVADEECKALWDYFTPDKLEIPGSVERVDSRRMDIPLICVCGIDHITHELHRGRGTGPHGRPERGGHPDCSCGNPSVGVTHDSRRIGNLGTMFFIHCIWHRYRRGGGEYAG